MAFEAEDGQAAGEAAPIAHGGDLGLARKLFPGAPEPWLDLSTGINPVPYPCPPLMASALHRLPSAADLLAIKETAASAYGAPGADHVVVAPGTQLLIGLLPLLLPRARIAVIGPTYAEHAAAWAQAGHAVATVPDLVAAESGEGIVPDARDPMEAQVLAPVRERAQTFPDRAHPSPRPSPGRERERVAPTGDFSQTRYVVAVSPNNPDGRVLAPDHARETAARLAARGGLLVVDAAFADLEPDAALRPAEWAGLVVLRSFGKTYGLPGLRLGFALAEPVLARKIEAALGPWAVSGPALAAGRIALADGAWRRQAAAARAQDAARLDRMFLRAGGKRVGGTSLFRTAAFEDAPDLFERLGRAGIFVRRFHENPSWLRFGLPAGKEAWCRLSRVLKPGAS